MAIRSHLRWLAGTGLSGLVVFAAVAFMALMEIEVNGPIYRKISLSQDLVSDYIPPSESLLQVALICNMMTDTSDPAELQRYIDRLRTAQHDFEARHVDYMHRVPEGPLKDMMRGTAYQTAEEYLQIAQQSFIPLVLKGDHDEARKVALERMKPVYEKHATAVDQIVEVANREARDGEALAARNVRLYTGIMVAVGLGVLLAGGIVFIYNRTRHF